MRSIRVWIGVGLFAALLLTIAIARSVRAYEMEGYGMWRGHGVHFFTNYLDLNQAQQDQVKQILAKDRPALKPLMQQMAQDRQQMRQVIESSSFDEAKARTLAAQQTQTITELTVQKAHMYSDLYQVLTPDQKTKLDKFLDRHEQRFMKHMNGPAGEADPSANQ